ncbi:DUF4123 domain-containing protein, partial [Luteibacter sp.]|uniref:DUF4123 domain-containing protein n=1 Tax=Luteibacter sp. TaxID=1886636 RepID=UPI002F4228C0
MDRQTDGDATRRVWAELRGRLIAQQERSAGATLYMLVDGRAIRDIQSLLGVIPGLSYTSLWLGTIGERMMGIGPWLARLEEAFLDTEYGLHEKLAVRVLHAPEKYAITWILSTASLDVLAAHFRAYTQCKFGHR